MKRNCYYCNRKHICYTASGLESLTPDNQSECGFGEEITTFKALHEATGMSLRELSRYFEIPYRTLQNWEAGVNTCPDYVLSLMIYKLQQEAVI